MVDILERVRSETESIPARPKRPAIRWNLPGFGPMTRISTSFGDMHAQTLRVRDVIRTQNGELKPIKWVDRMLLESEFLRQVPDAHAVLIRAGALGGGLPKADVVVSPEQKIGVGHSLSDVKFVKASELVGRPGVVRKHEDMFTYTLFHCGEPVAVRTEGLWAKIDP